MADSRKLVVSDLLCYVVNKFSRAPLKPLKSIVNDFYSADDICSAKDKLVEEVELLKIDKWAKPARRRIDSITRTQNEIDDIFAAIIFLSFGPPVHTSSVPLAAVSGLRHEKDLVC